MRVSPVAAWLTLVLAIALPVTARAQVEITLKNSFIEEYKNRATIDASYVVDKAHAHPNTPAKDGDLHIAGRAKEIGLPTVSEIMNARTVPAAVDAIHNAEGTDQVINLSGAWRIWAEHGGTTPQVQGKALKRFTTTNPDHVFEIHPLTRVDTISTSSTLTFIDGYQPKDAEQAFTNYESRPSTITYSASRHTTKITTSMGGYNYVEFKMVLNDAPRRVTDGWLVFAGVHDLNGDLLVRNRRMVFIDGTPPALTLQGKVTGDTLTVLGMPRINLTLVSWRTSVRSTRPEALTWNLPYEILIVGVKSTP